MASKIFISFLGGFIGLLTVIILFFLSDVVRDFLYKHKLWSQTEDYLRRRRRKRKDSIRRYRAKDGQGDYLATLPEEDEVLDIEEEVEEEELELDEYVSSVQEVVAVVVHSETKTVGLCAFTNDANVEYYVEDIPKDVLDKGKEGIAMGVAAAAMSAWNTKWVYAEEVNLLLQDESVVRALNRNGTRENRLLRRLQSKYSYNLHPQWTDNFICEAALEGLWTSLCQTASRLLTATNAQDRDRAWRQFELEHWHRARVNVRGEHFKLGKKSLSDSKNSDNIKGLNGFQDVSLVAITEEDEVNVPLL